MSVLSRPGGLPLPRAGLGGHSHLCPHAPAAASPSLELVRSSTLNSEHFPQPTQQIKDIVRQHQQLPRGGRPEAFRSAWPPQPSSHPDGGLPTGLRSHHPCAHLLGSQPPHPATSREGVSLFTQVVQMSHPGRERPGPLSRVCCVSPHPSLVLSGFSFIVMGVEEKVPYCRVMWLGRGDSVSHPPGRTAGGCS